MLQYVSSAGTSKTSTWWILCWRCSAELECLLPPNNQTDALRRWSLVQQQLFCRLWVVHNFKADPLTRFVLPFPPSRHFPASIVWLHAAGYLKTSNACEALTISGDCCWVISGKEVSLQFPLPPREHPSSDTHTCAQSHLVKEYTSIQKHTDSLSSALQTNNKRKYSLWIQRSCCFLCTACEEMQRCSCG